jgi:hypothetical protein
VKPEEVTKTVTDWYRHIGTKGGSSRSDAKIAAVRANAAKARKVREEKRRLGKGK